MNALSLVLAGVALAVLLCSIAFRRDPEPAAAPAPEPEPEPQRDEFDGPFSLAMVARRARKEAASAGRAAAEGRPIARRVDDLPSRKWIVERIEERIGELRGELATEQRNIDEDLEVARREEHHLAESLERAHARFDELRQVRAAERELPRHDQDLALERRVQKAEHELDAARSDLAACELRRQRLQESRERSAHEFDAQVTHLHEACDTLRMEHDMAYEAAEHGHPDVKRTPAAAGDLPVVAPLLDIAAISDGARHEGARAGYAAANGNPIAEEVEDLPSRRWVIERFSEHTSAVRAQLARYQRELGEELDVISEHLREADRGIERAKTALGSLDDADASDQAEQPLSLARQRQNAQRELDAAHGRSHEYELQRELLAARQARAEADFEAVIEQLKDAAAAAIAEHDMAYEAAEHGAPSERPAPSATGHADERVATRVADRAPGDAARSPARPPTSASSESR